jgi:hypothetical protein
MRWKTLFCILMLGLALFGCSYKPEDTLRSLERSWQQGVDARKSLLSKGLTADDKTCRQTYVATDAAHGDDSKELAALRVTYYVKGCLGLPKPTTTGTATTAPSTSSTVRPGPTPTKPSTTTR